MVLTAKHWLAVAGLVLLDQITKWFMLAVRPDNMIFQLISSPNTGAAFGILQGRNTALIFISIAVLALLWRPLIASQGHERWAYLLLCAGILGNFIDRVVHKGVIDFISIGNFPVFNIADMLITLSILYLVATAMRDSFSSWNFRRAKK